ncbi:UNVERIFIED_CONTAM: Secreted RxLR effector protein [Sesamum latifolium]|uniref:Secreted RxLR effector protein n=1 Tax=Sesamum latifolium TaxID=2727402 RepID=A0AAW2Y9S0_9LAMI
MTAQHKRKFDNHENAQLWHARLDHISKYRIRKLIDSKSLEVDDLDNLPTCESCLKGKMTKKSFVGQSTFANGLLDLIHIDICGPLNTSARGRYSYFITFTNDYYELPTFFWGCAHKTDAKLLNMAPSKMVPQTPYEIWHGKPAFYKYLECGVALHTCREEHSVLRKGFPTDSRRDEVLLEESCEAPQQNDATSFEPTVPTEGVRVLCTLTRESRPLERYGFVGLTSQLDNDPRTYGEAMSDIDLDKWFEAMKSEVDSMDGLENGLPQLFHRRIDLYGSAGGFHFHWRRTESLISKGPSMASNKLLEAGTHVLYEVIRGYNFIKNEHEPCVYKKISGSSLAYLVLHVDDILLIGNDVKMLGDIKAWLSIQFSMKDIDIRYAGNAHWSTIKTIIKYLKRTKDVFLIYGGGELILKGYNDASFQSDDDDAKSQSGFVFKLNGSVVAWKSSKQATTTDSTTEPEYIAASKAAKEAVWMKTTSKSWVWYLALLTP